MNFVFIFSVVIEAPSKKTNYNDSQCPYTQWLIYDILLKMRSYMVIIGISMNRRDLFFFILFIIFFLLIENPFL